MGERPDGLLGDRAGLDRRLQGRLDQAEAVLGGDLPPAVPAEHRGPVEQDDPLRLRLRGRLQEHLRTGPHRIERRGGPRVERAGGDPLRELDLDPLVDGLEKVALAAEMVVERAAGDAGRADDLLGADGGVAALGEERSRRFDQRIARRLRALGLGSFDIHTVCMYLTPPTGLEADK